MRWTIDLQEIGEQERHAVGGKGFALARMARSGFQVPPALCITVEAYQEYATTTGLRERILLELHRKDFREMRWEEVWDAALRIRNLFLSRPLPENLHAHLYRALQERFADRAVVVRSSSPEEDSARASFAGLHESFVNVAGTASILEHIRLVWASLWSDAALLYRQELGLDVHTSSMAVVVQQIITGDRSGVVFSQNPNDPQPAVIECVYGLNQGLVDGTIEPDRWQVDRTTRRIVAHAPAQREKIVSPGVDGVQVTRLPEPLAACPPLDDHEVTSVFSLQRFHEEKRSRALDLLDLARTSYRLRDNDNIHPARIEAQKLAAVEEGKRRLALHGRTSVYPPLVEEVTILSPPEGQEIERSFPRSHR